MSLANRLLISAIIVSALAVVFVRQQNRLAFVAVENLTTERDRLNVEYSRLVLERATWSQHHAVDYEARTKLNMQLPAANEIVTITLPGGSRHRGKAQ